MVPWCRAGGAGGAGGGAEMWAAVRQCAWRRESETGISATSPLRTSAADGDGDISGRLCRRGRRHRSRSGAAAWAAARRYGRRCGGAGGGAAEQVELE